MKKLLIVISIIITKISMGQTVEVKKYYDNDTAHIKEVFYVLESKPNILDGKYTSFYYNGNKRNEGEYKSNNAIGKWFFYYESGNLKMTGTVVKNESNGYWKYYFENGNMQMEGKLINNQKDGVWKHYYENGKLKSKGGYKADIKDGVWMYFNEEGRFKAQAEYKHGKGEYFEFYDDGKVKMSGPIENDKSNGHWVYNYNSGIIESEGVERNGLKEGPWKFYYEDGVLKSEGYFEKGKANGNWKYYHNNGNLQAEGKKLDDKKYDYWKVAFEDGKTQSEANYDENESGEYKEYYESGKLKVSGFYKNGKQQDLWKYFYEDGSMEGSCNYENGTGYYKGFYPNGSLKIEGNLKDSQKTGTWTLYDEKGKITGYYKTYDNEDYPVFSSVTKRSNQLPSGNLQMRKKKPKIEAKKNSKLKKYFIGNNPKHNRYIVSTQPLAPILSQLSLSYEYLVDFKYGHSFETFYVRNPLFNKNLSDGDITKNGYSINYRFKAYKTEQTMGHFYFANELRFNNFTYSTTILNENGNKQNLSKNEYGYEISALIGNRYNVNSNLKGLTFDIYMGLGIGYKHYSSTPNLDIHFAPILTPQIGIPIRLGASIGYIF